MQLLDRVEEEEEGKKAEVILKSYVRRASGGVKALISRSLGLIQHSTKVDVIALLRTVMWVSHAQH